MKIAVTGKGGVGKSTLAAMMTHLSAADGHKVLAVDADPDANLAFALGIPAEIRQSIIPVSCRTELIEERTGAKLKKFGQMFKLNPEVKDVVEKLGHSFNGIDLIVLGAIQSAGGGCACPENVFLKNLLTDILIRRDEVVIVDMEAGIEHLGRGTAKSVDYLIVVVEPSPQSINTAESIAKLAGQLGIRNVRFVANKIRNRAEMDYVHRKIRNSELIGSIPYSDEIALYEREERSLFSHISPDLLESYSRIYSSLSL